MKCLDCGNSVPGPGWRRCYDHALSFCRRLMSEAQAPSVKVDAPPPDARLEGEHGTKDFLG